MGKLLDLTFYNPAQLSDEDFLKGFVARRELADKILARLSEVKATGLAQHRLIIGQRGMGKTSLLRRIALGVRDTPALAATMLPLRFREEQYNVHNLHVLWCNSLDALGDWYEATGQPQKAQQVDRDVAALDSRADDDEGSIAFELFSEWMKREGKRPLLLLDNLDLIFCGLKEKQWSLRRFLQKPGGIVVVGASSGLLEATAHPEAPFHDFFQVDVLEKLSHAELLSCLRQLAAQRGEAGKKVLQVLDRDPGRIHVLYDLTGGNPRTLAMLYLMLEVSDDDDLMRDLERLLDLATPLYKARVEEFAPQARVVFDAVALAWNPIIAADVASVTGLETGAASSQLDRLHKDGILEKATLSTSVRTGFQVAERFFNIWYLMRCAARRQRSRLRWLTEFLRCFYTPQQLTEVAAGLIRRLASDHLGKGAYCMALSDAVDEPYLRDVLRYEAGREMERYAAESGVSVETLVDSSEVHSPRSAGEWSRYGFALDVTVGAHEKAEAAYRNAVKLDPTDDRPWNSLGNLLGQHLCRYDEAEGAYRKAIELNPECSGYWNNVGNLLTEHLGRYDEAEAAYRKAMELDPKNAAPRNGLGNLLMDHLGRYKEAEAAYRRTIELDPKNAAPRNGLGNLLTVYLGRYDEAAAAYRKAIELDPKCAAPWNNLGSLLTEHLGRYGEAEAAYRKAIELDPKDASPWNNLGILLKKHLGRYDEAEAAYRKAIELDPKDASPWNNLGILLKKHLGRYDEAEAAYRKAIELDPKYAAPWNGLGNLLTVCLGRYEEAEAAYRKAIELDPRNAAPWNGLGNLLTVHVGRYDEAEAAYRKAMELDPKCAWPWIGLGYLLTEYLGRYGEAEVAYRKAIELDPKYAWPWNGLGVLLTKHLGRYDEAEAAYRKAIELDPKYAWPWNNLGVLLTDHLGRHEEAEAAYRKAMELDPRDAIPAANLAYLLLDHEMRKEEADKYYQLAIAGLSPEGAGLLRAYRALAENNFGAATAELATVLEKKAPGLFSSFLDDILRVLRLATLRGYGEKLLNWFEESGLKDRFWPLCAAFDAYLHGDGRLQDVNPEVRGAARHILSMLKRGQTRQSAVASRAAGAIPSMAKRRL